MAHPAPWLTWRNESDVQILVEMSRNSTSLTAVTFEDYDGKMGKDFGLALGLALANNNRVKKLGISRKKFSDADMHFLSLALAKNSTISHLKIEDSAMGHIGVTALAAALRSPSSCVQSLCLSDVNMGTEGAKALAEALTSKDTALVVVRANSAHRQTSKPLSVLKLSMCKFGEQGIENLANAIAKSTTLTKLSLECAGLSRTDAQKLISAIKANTSLTDVNLQFNRKIGMCGAELLDAIQGNTRLIRLDLRNCDVPEVYLKQIETIISTNAINQTYAKYTSTMTVFQQPTQQSNGTSKKRKRLRIN